VVACEEEASVVVTVAAAAAAAGLVTCIIHVTSALMRTHPFQYYNGLSSLIGCRLEFAYSCRKPYNTTQCNKIYLHAPKSWRLISLIYCTELKTRKMSKSIINRNRVAQKKQSE